MAAFLLILVVCLFSFSSADGQDKTHTVNGPNFLVTDGTRNMTLKCLAKMSPGDQILWITPAPETKRCETGTPDNVCTFTPRLEDNNQSVICSLVDANGLISSRALYQVNLKFPPQSKPNITIQPSTKEPLKNGDIITCTVTGGKPRVASVVFYCQHPDLQDQHDHFSDDGRSVSSSITVDTSKATEQDIECTCKANWDPEPGLYRNQTKRSFQLDISPPRVYGTSYNLSNPSILAATGRTFFLVANPTPDTTKSFFIRPSEEKELVPDNTFKTEFTKNSSTETHLVNCRVTPQNVPEENLGLYELSISNGLGSVSLFVNVTSPVIQPNEKKTISPGVIAGGAFGVIALLGIIVAVVIFAIRRKRCADNKGHDDSTLAVPNMPPTATPHDVQPDANDTNNAWPSSTFIESEPGYATPGEVRKTEWRSTDSKSGAILNSEQDDYNHLNGNTAPPVDSSTCSRVGADSRGAQPGVSTDSAKPNSLAPHCNTSTGKITLPNGDEYSTVGHKQKGGNPSPIYKG